MNEQILEMFLKSIYHAETKMFQLTKKIFCTDISEFYFLI